MLPGNSNFKGLLSISAFGNIPVAAPTSTTTTDAPMISHTVWLAAGTAISLYMNNTSVVSMSVSPLLEVNWIGRGRVIRPGQRRARLNEQVFVQPTLSS